MKFYAGNHPNERCFSIYFSNPISNQSATRYEVELSDLSTESKFGIFRSIFNVSGVDSLTISCCEVVVFIGRHFGREKVKKHVILALKKYFVLRYCFDDFPNDKCFEVSFMSPITDKSANYPNNDLFYSTNPEIADLKLMVREIIMVDGVIKLSITPYGLTVFFKSSCEREAMKKKVLPALRMHFKKNGIRLVRFNP